MKGKTSNKLLALLSVVLIIALVAVPVGTVFKAYAAPNNYLPGTSGTQGTTNTTSFTKTLKIDNDYKIPEASFDFTISVPNDDVPYTATTLGVFAGVDPANIKVTLDNGTTGNGEITLAYLPQPKSTAAPNSQGDFVTITDKSADGYYLATKNIGLDFSKVNFTEPGVYRYIITETKTTGVANTAIGMDDDDTRTLDVYVEDATTAKNASGADIKQLKITGYVLYVGTVTTGPSNENPASGTTSGTSYTGEDGVKVITESGLEVSGAKKSVGFLNVYPTAGITFGKEVTGNQGSKDKYFKFTLTLNGVSAGDSFEVVLDKADDTIPANVNAATKGITTDITQPSKIDVTSGNTVSQDFYLQDGQYITVNGMYEGITYILTEEAEDYTSTAGIAQADSTFDKNNDNNYDALSDATSGTIAKNGSGTIVPVYTGYTNDKEGTIPTGVILSVAPWIIAGLIIVAGVVFFAVRSKKKYEEQ